MNGQLFVAQHQRQVADFGVCEGWRRGGEGERTDLT
jgi:hypothetical protein